jgi:5-methylthioadenosine/S-adenosylhomocysteine deaminase
MRLSTARAAAGQPPVRQGVRNDFLENALFDWAYMPILPPELTAAICALRHLRSGCTLLHHRSRQRTVLRS